MLAHAIRSFSINLTIPTDDVQAGKFTVRIPLSPRQVYSENVSLDGLCMHSWDSKAQQDRCKHSLVLLMEELLTAALRAH
jgi:hypothetical protein